MIILSRVTPFQVSFIGSQKIPTSAVTAAIVTNDDLFNDESQEQENTKERLLKEVEDYTVRR